MTEVVALLEAARRGNRGEINRLVAELERIDPRAISDDGARVAFWLNVYNALLLDELTRNPRQGSLLRHRGLFNSAAYCVGGDDYSLNAIEHGVLRLNARPPYALRRALSGSDPRLRSAPSKLDRRIHFALNCGAASCPPIRPYTSAGCDAELEGVTRAYLRAETSLDRERNRVELPNLLKLYSADFGDKRHALAFTAGYLADDDAAWVAERSERVKVGFNRFDWTIATA